MGRTMWSAKAPCSFSTLALILHFSCLFLLPPKAKPWAAYPYLQRGVVATGARAGGRAGRLFLTQVAKVRFQRNIPTPTSRQASTSGTSLLSHYTILSLVSHAPLPGLLRKPSFPSFGNAATFPLVFPSLGFFEFLIFLQSPVPAPWLPHLVIAEGSADTALPHRGVTKPVC
ncbi:hypothetical protein GQ607_001330 [Colletotrichum asianum]|uniref:Secreted protein n=1 Tax=Colletotrichum asianum TaxID=702518 RepID=A0A8H3ZT46_9PEZI|nr:hypothetical protein GQ607_001330 [Colletotrichum asianum]